MKKKFAFKKTNEFKIIKKAQKLRKNTNVIIKTFFKKIYIIEMHYLCLISKLINITIKY